MGLTVHFEVLNQLGTPMLYSSTLATRPPAGITGRIFYRTDSPFGIYRDNGVTWDLIGDVNAGGTVTGSGTATQVAYWDTSSSITSNSGLYYDAVNIRLGINNATPGAALDAHQAGGTIIQANSTTLSNSLMSFQLQGTGKWQLGNVYSAGTNYFRVYDQLNAVERFTIRNTGQIDFTGNQQTTYTVTGITGAIGSTASNYIVSDFTFNAGITSTPGQSFLSAFNDMYSKFSGSATFDAVGFSTTGLNRNYVYFNAAGSTITYSQATGIRALTALALGFYNAGANSGTISHYANFQIYGDQKTTSTTTFTNRYQLILSDIDEFTTGNTYTNRWAIYQAGALNTNYFAGKILTGTSTTVGTYQLDVTGTSQFTGNVTYNTGNITGISSHTITNTFAGGTANVNAILGVNNSNIVTGASASSTYGIYNYQLLDVTGAGGSTNQNLFGIYTNSLMRGQTSTSLLSGFGAFIGITRNDASDISTNANNNATALSIQFTQNTGSSTITTGNVYALTSNFSLFGGTITNAYALDTRTSIGNATSSPTTTITNFYFLKTTTSIGSASGNTQTLTNWYGIYLTAPTIGVTGVITNRWGIYAPDSSMNHSIVGSVAIGSGTITTSAQMSVVSTTKGFLPPVMTTAQKNAIASPTAGLIVFDTTLAKLCVYSGAAWQTITSV